MIKIQKHIQVQYDKKLKLQPGVYYMLDFKAGRIYTKEFPNRAQHTYDKWMKTLYTLDDATYFFDATNLGNFKAEQNRIIDTIVEVIIKLENEREKFPEGTPAWFILEKRVEMLKEWCERLMTIKAKWPLDKQIKKIRNCHPKLR
jgi:hypothetical protein